MSKNSIIVVAVIAGIAGGAYLLGSHNSPSVKNVIQPDNKQNRIVASDSAKSKSPGRIIYISNGSVHSIDPDGKNEKALTSGSRDLIYRRLEFSPDKKKILYNAPHGGYRGGSLKILNIDGSDKEVAVVEDTGEYQAIGEWHWFPDGSKIIFTKNDFGELNRDHTMSNAASVYTANADGTNIVKIASSMVNSPEDNTVSFSKDGKKVTYVDEAGNPSIMNVDGADKVKLVNDSNIDMPTVSWSPDGKKIAYSGEKIGFSARKLKIANIDGSGDVTTIDGCGLFRAWSPDSRKIACDNGIIDLLSGKLTAVGIEKIKWLPDSSKVFISKSSTIFVMNPDGTERVDILRDDNSWRSFMDISPDGKKIVYSELGNIYVADIDGSNPIQITKSGGCERPEWLE